METWPLNFFAKETHPLMKGADYMSTKAKVMILITAIGILGIAAFIAEAISSTIPEVLLGIITLLYVIKDMFFNNNKES